MISSTQTYNKTLRVHVPQTLKNDWIGLMEIIYDDRVKSYKHLKKITKGKRYDYKKNFQKCSENKDLFMVASTFLFHVNAHHLLVLPNKRMCDMRAAHS